LGPIFDPQRSDMRSYLGFLIDSDDCAVIRVISPDDLHAAFQRLARERVKVVLMLPDFMFLNERKRIALFAMAERLPTDLSRYTNKLFRRCFKCLPLI
jgi:hypothetical protein